MRKYGLLAVASAISLAIAIPVALAATTKVRQGVELRPLTVGTPAKPGANRLLFGVRIENDDPESDELSQPPLLKVIRLTLGKGFSLNGKSFPSTTRAKLDGGGPNAATKGSKIGTGQVSVILGTSKLPTSPVQLFNGPGGNKIELYVGAPLNQTIEGTLSGNVPSARAAAAKPGAKPVTITFAVPKPAVHPDGDTFRSLTFVNVILGADAKNKPLKITVRGKPVAYVTTVGPCAKNSTGVREIPITTVVTFYKGSDFPGEQFPSDLEPSPPSQTVTGST